MNYYCTKVSRNFISSYKDERCLTIETARIDVFDFTFKSASYTADKPGLLPFGHSKIILRCLTNGDAMTQITIEAVAYYRASTPGQGKTRLGLDAQKTNVTNCLLLIDATVVKEYCEIESGKRNKRKELQKAIHYCRRYKKALIIADMSRLTRNAFFAAVLLEGKVRIISADKPFATRLDLLKDSIRYQEEGEDISRRTKQGLEEARKRGVVLGKTGKALGALMKARTRVQAIDLMPIVEDRWAKGFNTREKLAKQFNKERIATFQGGDCHWHPSTIHTLLKRIEKLKSETSNDNQDNTISSALKTGT